MSAPTAPRGDELARGPIEPSGARGPIEPSLTAGWARSLRRGAERGSFRPRPAARRPDREDDERASGGDGACGPGRAGWYGMAWRWASASGVELAPCSTAASGAGQGRFSGGMPIRLITSSWAGGHDA